MTAVWEVDDRVHGAVVIGAVRFGEMDGQPVVKRDRSLRDVDEHRLDVANLRIGQDVLRLAEEDVDELAQADEVGARKVGHRTRHARRGPSNGIHAVTEVVSLIGQYG